MELEIPVIYCKTFPTKLFLTSERPGLGISHVFKRPLYGRDQQGHVAADIADDEQIHGNGGGSDVARYEFHHYS